jgi:hypothetical protein
MKIFILSAILVLGLTACEGTGDRTYNTEEPQHGDAPDRMDTTPTTNQNTYHTDSVSGQGSAYDTSNQNNQGSRQ